MDKFDYTKFRLDQVCRNISSSNEFSYKLLSLFQAYTSGFGIAAVTVYAGQSHIGLQRTIALFSIRSIVALFTLINLLLLLTLASNVKSWWHYRKEESLLVARLGEPGMRHPPTLRTAYYWPETWIATTIIIITLMAWLSVELLLVPSLDASGIPTSPEMNIGSDAKISP